MSPREPLKKLTWYSSALAAAMITTGASNAIANTVALDAVTVVSASGFEQKITDAPASITVVTRQDLEKKAFTNIAEALQDVEGVDIGGDTGKTGGLNISLRGMPSEYTLILIDGRRQNTAGNITPNGFNETSTSFLPPLAAIERIEVIRGPMSTLYGSDAMGGVINIITRKVAEEWGGSVTMSHLFQEKREAGDQGTASIFAQGPLINNKLGLAVRADVKSRAASHLYFDDGSPVNTRGPSPVEGRVHSLGAKLTYTPTKEHDVTLEVDSAKQVYNNDDCQLGTLDGYNRNCEPNIGVANGYAEELRFNREQLILSHTGRFELGQWDSSVMHNKTETIGRTLPGDVIGDDFGIPGRKIGDPRTLENTNLVVDSKFTAPLGSRHMATFGGQWWDAEMEDAVSPDKFNQKMWALFLEDEWFLHDDFALTLGGRYDRHDAFGGNFSPRAYAIWNPMEEWTIKGGVSQGYKTPSLNDLHDGVNGVTGQGTIVTIGNPNLKPETTTTTELGFYYDGFNKVTTNLTFFHNDFKDKIAQGDPIAHPDCGNNSGGTCAQKINVDSASTQGIEIGSVVTFTPTWKLSVNYTLTETEQKSGNNKGAPLSNTAKHMINSTLSWQATTKTNLWLRGEYRGKRNRFNSLYSNLSADNQAMYDELGEYYKGYELFHLGATYKPANNVTVSATVYNLFDKDFLKAKTYTLADGSTGVSSDYATFGPGTTGTLDEGRRYWLSVTYDF